MVSCRAFRCKTCCHRLEKTASARVVRRDLASGFLRPYLTSTSHLFDPVGYELPRAPAQLRRRSPELDQAAHRTPEAGPQNEPAAFGHELWRALGCGSGPAARSP